MNTNTINPSCGVIKKPGDPNTVLNKFDSNIMEEYNCSYVVQYDDHGLYDFSVNAYDYNNQANNNTLYEDTWFLNPTIGITLDGAMKFSSPVPGTSSYSPKVQIKNSGETGSGLDMSVYIAGTDFYDGNTTGPMCPTTNQLELKNFAYHAVNGNYDTKDDPRADKDGYTSISKIDVGLENRYNPNQILDVGKVNNNNYEVLQVGKDNTGLYKGNIVTAGKSIDTTFRFNVPSPCKGSFDYGNIYIWGQTI